MHRRIAGAQAPNTTQKQVLSERLLSTECNIFNNETMVFGNRDGTNILSTLETHKRSLEAQSTAIRLLQRLSEAHARELQLLQPYREQVTLIRELVLDKFSGIHTTYSTRWTRNSLAHGGRIATDIQIINDENDDERRSAWTEGFNNLYGITFNYANDILCDCLIQDIANIHADALSLDLYTPNDAVYLVRRAGQLIEVWMTWADDKTMQYPFREPLLQDMLCDLFGPT